jgi:1-acyl-sn-glycerol-3-phosphate acyltransferase
MFYRFVRPFARLAFYVYFRKIYVINQHKVPESGPIIFASNHPTAFIEPCLLACYQPRILHFLVRGDFFKKKWAAFLLKSLHMLPIYRFSEGFSKLKDNTSTFEACLDALNSGKCVMILVEGRAVLAKQLRKFQKGFARLSFDMMQKYPDSNLKVVPVGMTYSDANSFRSDVYISFGDPISVRDYKDMFKTNKPKALVEITRKLKEAVRPEMVDMRNQDRAEMLEDLSTLMRNELARSIFPLKSSNDHLLLKEIDIAKRVDIMSAQAYKESVDNIAEYKQKLELLRVEDYAVRHDDDKLGRKFLYWFLFIPAFIGKIFHYGPYALGIYAKKNLVKRPEFKGPVHIAVYLFLSFFMYVLYAIIGCIIFGNIGLLILPIIFSLGWLAIFHRDLNQWIHDAKNKHVSKERLDEIKSSRMDLIQYLDSINIRLH